MLIFYLTCPLTHDIKKKITLYSSREAEGPTLWNLGNRSSGANFGNWFFNW